MEDMKQPAEGNAEGGAQGAAQGVEKNRKPFRVFMWGALIAAALSFWLAKERLDIERPAVADAYIITGILALLGGAMAWSQGAAHERSRRSQQGLQASVDRLQDRMHDLPGSLMEESVRVAAREAEGRRADQERQAGELRAAQGEWERSSAAMLAALREQGELLRKDISARDAAGREAWERLASGAAERYQAAADIQSEKTRTFMETLSEKWEETLRAQRESFASEWREVLEQTRDQLERAYGALEVARKGGEETAAQQAAWRETVETFHAGLGGALDRLQALTSFAQGQEALLQKMEAAIRAFEQRSAELLEETAMQAQESLLDALGPASAGEETGKG